MVMPAENDIPTQQFEQFARKYKQAPRADAQPSHLDLSGGKFYVPDSDCAKFNSNLAEYLREGAWLYLHENRTDVFRFYADVDLYTSNRPTRPQYKQLANEFQEAFRVVYGLGAQAPSLALVVCATEPVLCDGDNHKGLFKVGIHLYAPQLLANRRSALAIRAALISQLQAQGDGTIFLDVKAEQWLTILDYGVYGKRKNSADGGLRMVFARKCEACPAGKDCREMRVVVEEQELAQSRGRSADTVAPACSRCRGKGKVDAGRPYRPYLCIDERGDVDDVLIERYRHHDGYEYSIRNLSIRVLDRTKLAREMAPNCPFANAEDEIAETSTRKRKAGGGGECERRTESTTYRLPFLPTDIRYTTVRDWMRARLPSRPELAELRAEVNEPPEIYLAKPSKVKGRGTFCETKNDYHANAGCYYVFVWPSEDDCDGTPFVLQRCYSTACKSKPKARKHALLDTGGSVLQVLFGRRLEAHRLKRQRADENAVADEVPAESECREPEVGHNRVDDDEEVEIVIAPSPAQDAFLANFAAAAADEDTPVPILTLWSMSAELREWMRGGDAGLSDGEKEDYWEHLTRHREAAILGQERQAREVLMKLPRPPRSRPQPLPDDELASENGNGN